MALVNVIAPIRTEPDTGAWRQTIFYPFALSARHARGEVLRVDQADTEAGGLVPAVDLTATHDRETGQLTVFAVNRNEQESASLDIRLGWSEPLRVVEHVVMGGGDLLVVAW